MANALNILNSIRSVAGDEYQARIPEATRENIQTVGNTIIDFQVHTNTFFTQLLNRIGKTVVNKLDNADDIFSVFGEETLEFGDTIQEIFFDLVKGVAYDDTFANPANMLATSKGKIHVEYTSIDRKLYYKTTVSMAQLREAFVSVSALESFIKGLIESLVSSYSYDKYVMLTETLSKHCQYVIDHDDKIPALIIPADVCVWDKTTGKAEWSVTGAKDFLKYVKIMSRKLKFFHDLAYFDEKGTEHKISKIKTAIANQVIALELSVNVALDVDALAVIFHLDKADIDVRNIELEDNALGTYKSTTGGDKVEYHMCGFIADKRAVKRGKSFEAKETFKNPELQYMNFWNHYWGYQSVSKLRDFVPILLTTKESA